MYRIVRVGKKFKVQKKGLLWGWNDVKRIYPRAKVRHVLYFASEAQAQKFIDTIVKKI